MASRKSKPSNPSNPSILGSIISSFGRIRSLPPFSRKHPSRVAVTYYDESAEINEKLPINKQNEQHQIEIKKIVKKLFYPLFKSAKKEVNKTIDKLKLQLQSKSMSINYFKDMVATKDVNNEFSIEETTQIDSSLKNIEQYKKFIDNFIYDLFNDVSLTDIPNHFRDNKMTLLEYLPDMETKLDDCIKEYENEYENYKSNFTVTKKGGKKPRKTRRRLRRFT